MTVAKESLVLHASAVAWHGRGILIRGPSGSGKSSLSLRLLQAGAQLVADDLVRVRREGKGLVASAAREPGLIEARGIGIFRLGAARRSGLALVVDLAPGARRERLPDAAWEVLLGVTLPRLALDASQPDASARLLLALTAPRAA